MKTRTFLPDALDALAADLERDGICTLQGLFDPGTLRAWGDRFASLVEQRRARPGGLAPRGAGRFYVTLPWTAPFADVDVFANPAILGVLDRVFAQEYRLVQFAVDTPVEGSEYQVTHRDYRPLFTEDRVTPLYALAAAIARPRALGDAGSALVRPPAELGDTYWAPEVAFADGAYHLYYSVGRADVGHQLRVARSVAPEGPYVDTGAPLLDPDEVPFAIDPHAFQDDDGRWYLFYACDFLDHGECRRSARCAPAPR